MSALGKVTWGSHITYYSLTFFIAYTFKGQVHVFAGRVKIVSHSSCRSSALLKYFCPLLCIIKVSLLKFCFCEAFMSQSTIFQSFTVEVKECSLGRGLLGIRDSVAVGPAIFLLSCRPVMSRQMCCLSADLASTVSMPLGPWKNINTSIFYRQFDDQVNFIEVEEKEDNKSKTFRNNLIL